MQYRTLGRTGIKVSPYALGAMMSGGAIGNPDHDDCIRIIHRALDAGINFVDTADAYSRGESEEVVGKALKGRRDLIHSGKVRVIGSPRCPPPTSSKPSGSRSGAAWNGSAPSNRPTRSSTAAPPAERAGGQPGAGLAPYVAGSGTAGRPAYRHPE
jgi:Aldo/keto reductase family